jgi:hypothetical protein
MVHGENNHNGVQVVGSVLSHISTLEAPNIVHRNFAVWSRGINSMDTMAGLIKLSRQREGCVTAHKKDIGLCGKTLDKVLDGRARLEAIHHRMLVLAVLNRAHGEEIPKKQPKETVVDESFGI